MKKTFNPFRNGVRIQLPKYTISKGKQRKSVFIDRNSIPRIKRNLGDFDYDILQQSKQKKKIYPN